MPVNKVQVQRRFAKAKDSYLDHAQAQKQIYETLADLIQHYCPHSCAQVFEIGCGTGGLTRLLHHKLNIQQYTVNDLYPEVLDIIDVPVTLVLGDAENITFPKQLDLVVSSSALQWMQNLEAVFAKVADALVSKGWFCFSIFGKKNLKEIRELTGEGLHYFEDFELKKMLQQQGFEVLYCQEQEIVLPFESPLAVLKHLKATGVTASSQQFKWTKQTLYAFIESYQQKFVHEQHVLLTYHPIYIIARRIV